MKKSIIKIVVGIALMIAGLFGAKLACDGAREIGKLGEYKLGSPVKEGDTVNVSDLYRENNLLVKKVSESLSSPYRYYDAGTEVFTASSLNARFLECQRFNERQGNGYAIKHVFVDGELMGSTFWERLKENEEQCNENGK